jgi:mRNA interferase MazF
MITSADNRSGAGDVKITDLRCAGLPSPSLVRTTKIATIETRDVESLGYLPEVDRAEVARHIHGYLAEVVVHA